jgi:regulator of sirC expression with transglutaminase-like and TPR domain
VTLMIEPRTALDAIGELPDGEIDLADAALQLARVDAPEADWRAARTHLSELARAAVRMAADIGEDDLAAQAGALAGLLGERYGYRGDTETYDDPDNANLIRVTERRRGLPVALGILWLHAARAAGWGAHGIDFPGHFLVGLEGARTQMVLDVFNGGQPLDARDLRRLLKRIEGSTAELRPGVLVPMGGRAVLLRLQNNIKLRRLSAADVAGALACAEDMLRIAPEEASLWREAALLHQRLEQVAAALRCYERFLTLVPRGDAAVRARAAMDELRSRLN